MLASNMALPWQAPIQAHAICLYYGHSEVINQIPRLEHGIAGFIYTKVDAPYKAGTDDAMCVRLNHFPDRSFFGCPSLLTHVSQI